MFHSTTGQAVGSTTLYNDEDCSAPTYQIIWYLLKTVTGHCRLQDYIPGGNARFTPYWCNLLRLPIEDAYKVLYRVYTLFHWNSPCLFKTNSIMYRLSRPRAINRVGSARSTDGSPLAFIAVPYLHTILQNEFKVSVNMKKLKFSMFVFNKSNYVWQTIKQICAKNSCIARLE